MKEGVKLKKNFFKYALFSVFLITTFLGIKVVNAEQYTGQAIWPSEFISNIYIKKYRDDGYIKYQQAQFIRRSEDNAFVYCLQPYVDIDNNLPYYNIARKDYASVINLTQEQWDKVALYAYYGYGYDLNGYNHSDKKWYAITQVLIWRTVEPTSRIVFTDSLNGNIVADKYSSEIAEMESLVASHYTRPNFESEDLVLPLGQSITLTDKNNVLRNYQVSSTENVDAVVNGNTITITSTGIGEAKINLVKKATKYSEPPILYYSNHSQNVMRVGYYDPIPAKFNLTVVGGRVEITKVDSETKKSIAQGDGLLSNAVYGIYNTSNEKIAELVTNNDAYVISDYLPSLGEFYLKEITPSKGYELDNNKYPFVVDKNNLLASVKVYEKVIDSNLTIFKVYASDKTGVLTPEPNITFDIYLKSSNELYKSITTDKNGYATIKLPYGTWVFKQKNSTPNFEKTEDFEIVINENTDENIYNLISNAEITAKLKVIKVDKETGEVIKRRGIKFKIKSILTNDYVCQTITYPTAKTICEYETDDNGVLITPYPLVSGKYKLEEVDQVIDGYLWNKESVEFEIGENANLITDNEYGVLFETKFENQPVKGEIELNKIGEKFVVDNGTYDYELIDLSNVKFGLYDIEGNLISEVVTDKNGYAKFDKLKLGTYIVKEIETLPNYILDENEYKIELKYKDQYTAVINKTVDIENKLSKGELVFTKTDYSTSEAIPNTKIQIFMYDDLTETLIGEYITNDKGEVVIDNLPSGHKYFILETEATEGYVLNEEKMYFEITSNGEIIKANMTNEKIKSTIIIHKVDEEENPLSGVVIGIYDLEDNLIGEYTTDENGNIEVELEYGSYYYQELKTIDKYILNNEKVYFDIITDGEVIESTLINIMEEVEVPSTNQDKNYLIYIICSAVGIVGMGLIIYDRKNKR